jgi:hypothetical protein
MACDKIHLRTKKSFSAFSDTFSRCVLVCAFAVLVRPEAKNRPGDFLGRDGVRLFKPTRTQRSNTAVSFLHVCSHFIALFAPRFFSPRWVGGYLLEMKRTSARIHTSNIMFLCNFLPQSLCRDFGKIISIFSCF